MFNKVFQEVSIMVGQTVLHHGQHIEGRVGKILKPLSTPVH